MPRPPVVKVYFAVSQTIFRGVEPEDRQFILRILNEYPGVKWAITDKPEEAEWHITMETQFYIDQRVPDDEIGESSTFVYQKPFLTRISADHWRHRPEPRSAFLDTHSYRRYIITKQMAKVLNVPFLHEKDGEDVIDHFDLESHSSRSLRNWSS